MSNQRQPMFGKFSRKHTKYCPNCGSHYSKCGCWQEYVEGQLPLYNQGDDMYIELPVFGSGLITEQEVKAAAKPSKGGF